MARPKISDTMSLRDRELAANMLLRNETWETIFKYINVNDTISSRDAITQLADELETPLTDALYQAHINLAEIDQIMVVAAEKSNEGSPPHMARYKQLAELRIKIVNQIDELQAKEEERGNSWEPSFDTESLEFKIFKAAMILYLEREEQIDDGFDELTSEEKARFFQILSEGA